MSLLFPPTYPVAVFQFRKLKWQIIKTCDKWDELTVATKVPASYLLTGPEGTSHYKKAQKEVESKFLINRRELDKRKLLQICELAECYSACLRSQCYRRIVSSGQPGLHSQTISKKSKSSLFRVFERHLNNRKVMACYGFFFFFFFLLKKIMWFQNWVLGKFQIWLLISMFWQFLLCLCQCHNDISSSVIS